MPRRARPLALTIFGSSGVQLNPVSNVGFDADGFRDGARFQREIDDHVLADIDGDTGLYDRLKTLKARRELVTSDANGSELVTAIRSCGSAELGTRTLVSKRHFGAGDGSAGGVRDRTENAAGIDLGLEPAGNREEQQGCRRGEKG